MPLTAKAQVSALLPTPRGDRERLRDNDWPDAALDHRPWPPGHDRGAAPRLVHPPEPAPPPPMPGPPGPSPYPDPMPPDPIPPLEPTPQPRPGPAPTPVPPGPGPLPPDPSEPDTGQPVPA